MFRNIYLEAYKSAFYQDARLEVLLCHLNNIYSTLGSIMQDMEFMITRIVVANQKQLKVQNQIASTDRNQTKCP